MGPSQYFPPVVIPPSSICWRGMELPQVATSTVQSSLFYMLKRMELPMSHHPLVSPLYFTCWGRWNCPSPSSTVQSSLFYLLKMNGISRVPSSTGQSSLFYLLKMNGIARVPSSTGQSSLFYLLKVMELPKSLPPLLSPLTFTVTTQLEDGIA